MIQRHPCTGRTFLSGRSNKLIPSTDSLNKLRRAMPTVRFIPRGAEYRYHNKALERFFHSKSDQNTLSRSFGARHSSFEARKLLCMIGSVLCIKSLHEMMTKKHVGTFYPTQCMQSFDDNLFFKMFRFRREHFYKVLGARKRETTIISCQGSGFTSKTRSQAQQTNIRTSATRMA